MNKNNLFKFNKPERSDAFFNISILQAATLVIGFLFLILIMLILPSPLNVGVGFIFGLSVLLVTLLSHKEMPIIFEILNLTKFVLRYNMNAFSENNSRLKNIVHDITLKEFYDTRVAAISNSSVGILYSFKLNTFSFFIKLSGESISFSSDDTKSETYESFGRLLAYLTHEKDLKLIKLFHEIDPLDVDDLFGKETVNSLKQQILSLLTCIFKKTKEHQSYLMLTFSLNSLTEKSDQSLLQTAIEKKVHNLFHSIKASYLAKEIGEPLSYNELLLFLKRSWNPTATASSSVPWPSSVAESWNHVKIGETFTSVFWISSWPIVAVGGEFLSPLVLKGPIGLTLCVCLKPTQNHKALNKTERLKTEALASIELKSQMGITPKTTQIKQLEEIKHRLNELTDGHTEVIVHGFVILKAHSYEHLNTLINVTESAACESFLELRRLNGTHLEAYKAIYLPIKEL